MRLLRTKKLKVVEFHGHDVPPYAVLSHTWEEEEVSFQDVEQGLAKTRHGFGKVAGACALAIKDGFDYIWIDTCCIDRSSSAELSEAVNSMFRWYRDAEVCYAFLSDVDADEDPHLPGSSFRRARWFTRGWTLQELIAPGVVYFYGTGWKEIGSRSSLVHLIADITGISRAYFATGDLSQFSAAQKMAWAANRKTTRPEDEAYCLLGLFDINMPLLYGEGQRAFVRLQEEILRQSEDDSLFSHNETYIFATSARGFLDCHEISKRQAWPYKNNPSNPSLCLNRNLSMNRSRITMTFPVIRVSESEDLREFYSVGWPRNWVKTPLYLALLNCSTSDSTPTLLLQEKASGVFVKSLLIGRGYVQASMESRLAKRMSVMTLSIERTAQDRNAWDWKASRFGGLLADSLLQFQIRTNEDNAALPPMMWPIVRPIMSAALTKRLATAQDRFRNKVVVKGPCHSTTDFRLQYVHVGNFRLSWLERGDEAHLIPKETGDQGQPCLVYSSPSSGSFMVTLRPTWESVNATLYTDIPPWEGKATLAYIEMLERNTKGRKDALWYVQAGTGITTGKDAKVRIRNRRRNNGWWVYVEVDQ
ncbi:hypothetical protein VTI74DRAFT_10763 [Chaetomium olivicolor]